MKLILRKKDSATSILLFIFNNYLDRLGKDYIELQNLIEIMKAFNKNEAATRMAISRAVKNGVLINIKNEDKVIYKISNEGKKFIQTWNKNAENFWKRYNCRKTEWNNKWYCLTLNTTKDISNIKGEITSKFEQLGLVQFNTNVWITPYYQKSDIEELINDYNLWDNIIEFYGEIILRKNINIFLQDIFSIDKLKNDYREFINSYNSTLLDLKRLKEGYFNNQGQALSILYELGYKFYNIAANDPMIPKDIINEWEGDKAAFIMKELRKILLEYVYEYFKKLN